jgi:hypothetical protein
MTPTLEQLEFWRGMVAQARLTIERPTQENAARLRKLGERAHKMLVPGYKIPGRLQSFRAFNLAARTYAGDGPELERLADLVEAAVDAAMPPPLRERKDFA